MTKNTSPISQSTTRALRMTHPPAIDAKSARAEGRAETPLRSAERSAQGCAPMDRSPAHDLEAPILMRRDHDVAAPRFGVQMSESEPTPHLAATRSGIRIDAACHEVDAHPA